MGDDTRAEDVLMHFGVKGMKWGKSSAGATSGSSGKKTKTKTTSADIKTARNNIAQRKANIINADIDVRFAKSPQHKKKALAIVEKNAKELMTSDDNRIASKFTKGEKVTAVMLTGPVGVVAVGVNSFVTRKK